MGLHHSYYIVSGLFKFRTCLHTHCGVNGVTPNISAIVTYRNLKQDGQHLIWLLWLFVPIAFGEFSWCVCVLVYIFGFVVFFSLFLFILRQSLFV